MSWAGWGRSRFFVFVEEHNEEHDDVYFRHDEEHGSAQLKQQTKDPL